MPTKMQKNSAMDAMSRMLSRSEPLSFEQERTATPEQLVLANLRYAVTVARSFSSSLPIEDRIQEANAGLVEAAKRFDPSRGFKFITYAVWWMKQRIYVASYANRTVRVPQSYADVATKTSKCIQHFEHEHCRTPDVAEIASITGDTPKAVRVAMVTMQADLYLDDPRCCKDEEKDPYTMLHTIPDSSPLPDEVAVTDDCRAELYDVLAQMCKRDRVILIRYFGLDGEEALTLSKIGDEMKITRERIRQIKDKALRVLRHKLARSRLREDLIDEGILLGEIFKQKKERTGVDFFLRIKKSCSEVLTMGE